MTKLFTIKLSEAIVCAMQLDCSGMRRELGIEDGSAAASGSRYVQLKRGCRITATLDVIERIANHMTRERKVREWDPYY